MKNSPKIGRPLKSEKTKMSAKIFINMTEIQKKKLVKKAEESQKSLSQICLEALKIQKII